MGTWNNPDGLHLEFGPDKTLPNKAGEYVTTGALREIELKIDLTTLTQAELVQSDTTFFPKMRIQEVEVITHTAAATGVAIDVGLIRTDRATEIDYDGLLVAFPVASMSSPGERFSFTNEGGGTGEGALIGTTTSFVGLLTASATTATAFTTGVIFVKIRYYAV